MRFAVRRWHGFMAVLVAAQLLVGCVSSGMTIRDDDGPTRRISSATVRWVEPGRFPIKIVRHGDRYNPPSINRNTVRSSNESIGKLVQAIKPRLPVRLAEGLLSRQIPVGDDATVFVTVRDGEDGDQRPFEVGGGYHALWIHVMVRFKGAPPDVKPWSVQVSLVSDYKSSPDDEAQKAANAIFKELARVNIIAEP